MAMSHFPSLVAITHVRTTSTASARGASHQYTIIADGMFSSRGHGVFKISKRQADFPHRFLQHPGSPAILTAVLSQKALVALAQRTTPYQHRQTSAGVRARWPRRASWPGHADTTPDRPQEAGRAGDVRHPAAPRQRRRRRRLGHGSRLGRREHPRRRRPQHAYRGGFIIVAEGAGRAGEMQRRAGGAGAGAGADAEERMSASTHGLAEDPGTYR
ncbi:hypothetical protein BJ912DRAFT_703238 [Pholiota molesta]|nr:hypothetical protein BJ912DRAFT_703238 [Pholiota molesta]